MGLIDTFWKRSLSKEEKEEKARLEQERKTSKSTEEVVAAIGEIRVEDRQLAEFERISKEDETGSISWLASLTKLTRGTSDILDAEAQAWLGWKVRRLYVAYKEGNQEMYDYLAADLMEIFAEIAPMMVPKGKPDVYTLPVTQKPGNNLPAQNAGLPTS